jgi:transposase
MGDYLKRWGLTPQKPVKKAWEQTPVKAEGEISTDQVRVKQENATIFWGDETCIKNTKQHGRCYAPKGKTPVQPIPAKRVSLNMISAIANQGEVRFMLYESTMNAKVLIIFLRELIESTPGKVLLILDNLRVHHAKKAKRWLANQTVKRYLEVFFLPAHSPELNPDEYLNCDLKNMLHSGAAVRNVKELRSCMLTLQRRPMRVKSYLNSQHKKYAA